MTDRDQQFLALYQQFRFNEQQQFYQSRVTEFQMAHGQDITLSAVLMFFASTAAALAAVESEWASLWVLLAIVFPILSTAVSAYNELYAFERLAKLYQDAANALLYARADAPDLQQGLPDAQHHRLLSAYVEQVESIFRREQSQWGQLRNEVKIAELPSAQTQQSQKS